MLGGGIALVRRWYRHYQAVDPPELGLRAIVPPSYGDSTTRTPKIWEMTHLSSKFKLVGAYINPTLLCMKGHRNLDFIVRILELKSVVKVKSSSSSFRLSFDHSSEE